MRNMASAMLRRIVLEELVRQFYSRFALTRRLIYLMYRTATPEGYFIARAAEWFVRKPWWFQIIARRSTFGMIVGSMMLGIIRRINRSYPGYRLALMAMNTLFRRYIRSKYGYEAWIAFFRELYSVHVWLDLWLWRTFQRIMKIEVVPLAYLRYEPKSTTPVFFRQVAIEAKKLDAVYHERLVRALIDLVKGNASLDEILRRYPEFGDLIELLRTRANELGGTSRKVVHVVPVIDKLSSGVVNVFFYAIVADVGSRLSDPYLAASYLKDIHVAVWRWKFEDEIIMEVGRPSYDVEDIILWLDDLGDEVFGMSLYDILADQPMAKTFVASSWGKPEDWWRIRFVDVVATFVDKIVEARDLRRRFTHELIRSLVYFLGWRW